MSLQMPDMFENSLQQLGIPSPSVGARAASAALFTLPKVSASIRPHVQTVCSKEVSASHPPNAVTPVTDISSAIANDNVPSRRLQPIGGRAKRLLDLLVASIALVLVSPVMIFIPLVIKITTGGPVLFVHRRIGFNGAPFDCYKFRTMVRNAEEVLERHLSSNPDAAQEWEANQKLKCDPRVVFFGHMLRRSSLDELPQLFNIMRGDMSCVGPRPVVADELERYGTASLDYLKARPGLTGLWQVSGRNLAEYSSRVSIDTQYIQTWSFARDLKILARTIPAILRFDQTS
ncbi:sugar transferase [Mesorhizobium sp. L103C119B0]|uniref:sugar transferase n=1 Tax=Mesorhizobium sp. L103C119B0 TaxID=1287085 RepID=UPI00042216D1|nr:sugar transferase [Mesorhizobium sp. L103C119B0]